VQCDSSAWLLLCVLLQCADLLKQARTKYGNKDLMGALKLYEDVLAQVRTGRRFACLRL
jgi:hypothetical protein